MIIKNAVGNIKFNLNTYFGEEGALIGADVPEREKADLRRRYIRSNGGRSLFNYLELMMRKTFIVFWTCFYKMFFQTT